MQTDDQTPGLSVSEIAQLLASEGATVSGDGNVRVSSVFQDSRRVETGSLFAARGGAKASGVDFARDAISRGATAILLEKGTADPELCASWGVPVVEVEEVRRQLSKVAEAIYGYPSRGVQTIGITGTNGKTTTAILVERALIAAGKKPGRLGTIGSSFAGVERDSNLTTPEADDLSRFLADVRDNSGTHVVMEVSSHSIAQGRVSGLRFDVAAFSNLTQDHLDFHGTMQHYRASKLALFTDFAPRVSVINTRDATGREFAATARSSRVLRVGVEQDCDVRPVEIVFDQRGIRGDVLVAGNMQRISTRLVGEHNLENLLLALGILEALSVDLSQAVSAWTEIAVPGRLERCDAPEDDIVVLVDYAHTPDALERALAAARPLTNGRVHCVFGCGGDRDPTKRPKMGAIVGRLADRVIVTNDNPRTERPEVIAAAIEAGLTSIGARYELTLDRAAAIEEAVLTAESGDVVLLAGKGHEPYQIIGTEKRAFDDRIEARRALELRRARKSV
ncbi:MAG TPA: UDP-N-acetylmuramoyl-L-alanyl-D-glutamate--2,6-diaminopimelate ligase [Polyangiaceae bacterium]|nr:UDP-N-acetylmuramoyl-L-alanyl-D-glutamate--2,6-diaminopimelate ligase [Polyangiaceae bacterium]